MASKNRGWIDRRGIWNCILDITTSIHHSVKPGDKIEIIFVGQVCKFPMTNFCAYRPAMPSTTCIILWKLGLKNELAGGKILFERIWKHLRQLVDGFDGQRIRPSIPHGRLRSISGWVSWKIWIFSIMLHISGLLTR